MRINNIAAKAKLGSIVLSALCTTAFLGTTFAAARVEARTVEYDLDIPSQKLNDALQAFALASHHKLLYSSELVDGKKSPALKGQFTSEQAVKALLGGSNLAYQVTSDGLVLIRAADEPPRTMASAAAGDDSTGANSAGQEGKKSSSHDFRLAQVDQNSIGSPVASSQNSAKKDEGLTEIIVTAQKRAERLQDVPIAMSVLSGAQLDSSAQKGLNDWLNETPGVAASLGMQGGGTQIAIRGVSASAPLFSGSSPNAYYLDWMPFGLVRSAAVPDADVFDLNRIEVLRGPQGTLYGATALNGVVRVLTEDANLNDFDFKARALSSTTDFGGSSYGGDAAVNLPIIPGIWAARVVFGEDTTAGWIRSNNSTQVNSGELGNVRVKMNAQPTDALTVSLSAWHSQANYDAPPTSLENYHNLANEPQPISTEYNTYGLKVAYDVGSFTASSMTSYLNYHNAGILDLTAVGAAGLTLYTGLGSNVFNQELLLTSDAGNAWRWTLGSMYRDGRDLTFQTFNGASYADFADVSKSSAVYGEIGHSLFIDSLSWTLGARYFHDDVSTQPKGPASCCVGVPMSATGESFSNTSPKAVLTWQPSRDLTTYASYTQGFRSGLPQNETSTYAAPFLAATKPDKLSNYEIGAKGDLWQRTVSFNAAIYYIDWKNIQQQLQVPILGAGQNVFIAALVNGTSASGIGFDVGVTVRPFEGLELSGTYSANKLAEDGNVYSQGVVLVAKGARPNLSPETTASARAEYTWGFGSGGLRGRVAADANYMSPQVTRSLVGTESTVYSGNSILITDLQAGVETADHWTAYLFVDNLDNDRGISQPQPNAAYEPRPRPRTAGIQLGYRFR